MNNKRNFFTQILFTLFAICTCVSSVAQDSVYQYSGLSIQSSFTLNERRASFKKYLFEKTIKETFTGPLNQYTEYKFENACLSATQFILKNQYTKRGFDKMFDWYYHLSVSAKQALLAAVYGIYPHLYFNKVLSILPYERDPKLFTMAALYAFKNDSSVSFIQKINNQITKQFTDWENEPILTELKKYLHQHSKALNTTPPSFKELFNYQQLWKQKTIYSFQRYNRDFSGICIIQYEDGSFARDSAGKLITFRQLARSGSGMPYFITNGNTPQGVYRIAGINSSNNQLIGPTPNLQSIIPFQKDTVFYRGIPFDSTAPAINNYKMLLPPSWQNYLPMQESFFAGKVGRRYIIVHGSTLDAAYFKTKPFYPLTPTDGCLATSETWDGTTGKLTYSDQLRLVNTFLKTPATMGLLMVINIDNQQKNVSPEEIENLIKKYTSKQ